jgi:cyclophilin family peptidyl-prolyl cis-trans isomerase/HEAT repeat protein
MNVVFRALAFLALAAGAGCGGARPAATTPPRPPQPDVTIDQKIAWLLRLEQQRVLRDAGAASVASSPGARSFTPARAADLEALAVDPHAGVRLRALLAIGRTGLREGVLALAGALGDPNETEENRATAAFALGLLGARDGLAALATALKDPSARIRGRAMEAVGMIGDAASAGAVADASSGCAAWLGSVAGDDDPSPMAPELEACRLALFALVRLGEYDALARVALDERGLPVSHWWPVAYALQRIGDPRAAYPLAALLASPGIHARAFAMRGLTAARDARVVEPARAIAADAKADVRLRVMAVRALGALGGPAAVTPLIALIAEPATPRNLQIEAVAALAATGDRAMFDVMLELFTDPWPTMRAAALAAAAKINPDGFLLVISNMERDRDWSVRAALAGVLATLPADRVQAALADLVNDSDVRVKGPALQALAQVGSPTLARELEAALETPDYVVRATAARIMGEKTIDGGAERLVQAYARGQSDVTYVARAAALEGLAKYGLAAAGPTLREALSDKEWPVRVRAADLLRALGEAAAMPVRPAPLRQPVEFFQSEQVLRPKYSPRAFVETRRGTIEFELNLTEAPITSHAFVELARAGFFNGLKLHRVVPNFVLQGGDPRGDGEGGPGFTLRDELSAIPYGRGTVGMAIDGRDTAGSQFFITTSPQPHLDGRYTVFGRVMNGFEVLDQLAQWDVIERIRIWDGIIFK